MLRFTCPTRTALPRRARADARLSLCRSAQPDGGSHVSTVERPQNEEDAKVKATLSTLDALLGAPDATTPSSSRIASSSTASSSDSSSTNSSRQNSTPPASTSQPTRLPSLPSFGASPTSSAPTRKPAGLSFDHVMGFSGLAPEVINGRAAMIGFFLAIGNELKTGESVFAQSVSGGAAQALIVILAVTVASFAPAIRGTPLDEVFNKAPKKLTEWGPFTAAAEGLNGRLAMMGLALLIFFEGAGSTAFFLN